MNLLFVCVYFYSNIGIDLYLPLSELRNLMLVQSAVLSPVSYTVTGL